MNHQVARRCQRRACAEIEENSNAPRQAEGDVSEVACLRRRVLLNARRQRVQRRYVYVRRSSVCVCVCVQ